jgi:hypothetical protein
MVEAESLLQGTKRVEALNLRFVAEPAGRYELKWRRLSRAGRDYWRAWVTDTNSGRYLTPEPVAGFVPTADQGLATRRFNLSFKSTTAAIRAPITKFGGQPTWLHGPEWPLSRSTGRPMRFICQVSLREAGLGEPHSDRVAYLFMTDSEFYGGPVVEHQYDPTGGENAVIIQPGTSRPVRTASIPTGPSLVGRTPGHFFPNITEPVEFAVSLTPDSDPTYRGYQELVSRSPPFLRRAEPGRGTSSSDGDAAPDGFDWRGHFEAVAGNKLGGTPPPFDPKRLPISLERANLILQLDMATVPFFVDFGDMGVGHLFFDADSDQGYFTWSGS